MEQILIATEQREVVTTQRDNGMETDKLREIAKIPLKKKRLPEQRKYQRHLWNMLFVELLLQKMQEKEQREVCFEGSIKKQQGEHIPCQLTVQRSQTEETVPLYRDKDGGRDSLELSLYCFESILWSQDYSGVAGNVRRTGMLALNRLVYEAGNIMQAYYAGQLDDTFLRVIYRQYCITHGAERKSLHGLGEVYECFARANARKAVQTNRNEGRKLIEECGLTWAGTTYYNSDYFYLYRKVRRHLQEITEEAALELDVPEVDFARVEQESRFCLDGGLSFHGVFEWIQMQNNYPSGQYGFRNLKLIPPENFIYIYRNGYSCSEEKGIKHLISKMKKYISEQEYENPLWRFLAVTDGNEYHNGGSYLLEPETDQEKIGCKQVMDFLANFRLYRIHGCVEILLWGD